MIISLLVAMDEQRGIGVDGRLPWHLSDDLKRFKALTMGHHLIMGRKTWESIGRPLPGRITIVVTRNPHYVAEGCLVAHSLEEALALAQAGGEEEAFIIGGGEVFVQALPLADRIYLTRVHTVSEVDVTFPEFDPEDWTAVESAEHPADGKNDFPTTFQVLERAGDRG